MSKAKSLPGAALKLMINNSVFGIATSIQWESSGGRRSIMGLDQITPFELAPGSSTISGRIECARIRLDGGLEGRGIAVPDSKLLLEKYISIMLLDRFTDTVILRIDRAAIDNQSWQVSAKGLLTGSFTFLGMEWINEAT